ncbi:MAG TPA: hypothetical protein VHI77_08350 [Solirubrobacterales bacterium]|jgi:ribosomal protein S27AE|nr:hypothetical protein [Solirubrobacterales bacterium]
MVEEPDRPPKTHDAGEVRVRAGTGAATGRDERRSRALEFGRLQFGREVLAQALGTAIGAGLIALIGVVVGALQNVSLTTITLSAGALAMVAALAAVLSAVLQARIETLREQEACPNCGELIPAPFAFHGGGSGGMTMHSQRDCPRCDNPLIWFREGPLATGWRLDDAERRRRERMAEFRSRRRPST